MPDYRVEGTSMLIWSLLVEADSESEASEGAVRIAGHLSDLRQGHALRDARHEIVGCRRLIETPALEQVPHRSDAQNGG
jgi:LDH2 family malate/lactate/ureidoglycolate dehydrogenase